MATRFLKISSNGNKILKSKLMTVPFYIIIFNFSFLFSIDVEKHLPIKMESRNILVDQGMFKKMFSVINVIMFLNVKWTIYNIINPNMVDFPPI